MFHQTLNERFDIFSKNYRIHFQNRQKAIKHNISNYILIKLKL